MFLRNICVFFALISSCLAILPPDIVPCKAGDVVCIKHKIEEILRKNPNGRKDIGLPNLEPFHLKEFRLSDPNGQSALNLDLVFHDSDIFGLSKAIVEKVVGFESDPNTSKFELYGILPKIDIKGSYTADGRILILPIQGKGPAFITATDCKASVRFKPTVTKVNGKTVLGVKQIKVLLEPKKVNIRLENLFNGDKALGENMNLFLNENWPDVWLELGPSVNRAMGEILKTLLAEVYKNLTYDDFYEK